MRSKYSVGLFIFSFVLLYLISYKVYGNKSAAEEKVIVENTIMTDGQALNEECYYLFEANGYVVVYLSDKKTPYEYTDIIYHELPELLKQEIQNGKYIKDKEELYGFLENYSS